MSAQTHSFIRFCISPDRPSLWERIERPITAALLTIALGLTAASLPARGNEVPAGVGAGLPSAQMTGASMVKPLPDGVYVYGQTNQPDQTGSVYMVFEVVDRQIYGAFYMPQSSYDCFYGNVQDDQLALTVVDSYEQQEYPYAVALDTTAAIASTGNPSPAQTGLMGYAPVVSIPANNYTMLNTCRTDQ